MANKSDLAVYKPDAGLKLSLRDLMVVLFRRRWIVLGVSLPIIFFGIYGTVTTTDRFTASSQVLLEMRSVEDPSFQQRAVDVDALMSTAVQIAQSIPVATKAAVALFDSLPQYREHDRGLGEIKTRDDLRDVILEHVECGQVGESNLLSIRYSHVSADFALAVVGALTSAYIQYNIEKGQNAAAIGYYAEQIAETQDEIDALMAQRLAVYDSAGLNAGKTNNEAGVQQMRSLESTYYKAVSRRMGLEERYRGVVDAIALNSDYMPSLTSSGKDDNLVVARAAYDKALLELARLRTSYQDSSQFVIRQMEYVAEARRIYHEVRGNMVSDVKIDLDMAIAEEQGLRESLEKYKADLLAYPALEKELYSIDLQIEAKKDLLESLQVKRGEVRLKVQGDERISNITRLNVPSIELGVGGGKKFLYLFVAALFALALGVIVALLLDMQDHRIYDRHQAEVALQLPVLGAVSPSRTVSEKR